MCGTTITVSYYHDCNLVSTVNPLSATYSGHIDESELSLSVDQFEFQEDDESVLFNRGGEDSSRRDQHDRIVS